MRGGRGGSGEERVGEPDDAGPAGRRRLAGPHAENLEAATGLAPPPHKVPAPQIIGRPSEVEPLLERAGQPAAEVERAAARDSFAASPCCGGGGGSGGAKAEACWQHWAKEPWLRRAPWARRREAWRWREQVLLSSAWAIEGGSHLMAWGAHGFRRLAAEHDHGRADPEQHAGIGSRGSLFRWSRIDTESESEPRNRPLPQIRSRPARRPRRQAQTPFGLNNVPIPASSGSERSRVSRQSRGDRGPLGTQPSFDALRQASEPEAACVCKERWSR